MFLLDCLVFAGLVSVSGQELAAPLESGIERRRASTDSVSFWLWTKDNKWGSSQRQTKFSHDDEWHMTNFDPTRKTKFLVHGYNSELTWFGKDFVEAYFENDFDYNIIGIDWQEMASDRVVPLYEGAAGNVLVVGRHVGDFIWELNRRFNYQPSDIHCIGHSLGAQMCGKIGREIQTKSMKNENGDWTSGFEIGRVSGIDPAGPKWVNSDLSHECLSKTDATFVDVVHTNGALNGVMWTDLVVTGHFGNMRPMGDVDFYINGGEWQGGCSDHPSYVPRNYLSGCSHGRARTLYIQSIGNPNAFEGRPCYTMEECNSLWQTPTTLRSRPALNHAGENAIPNPEWPEDKSLMSYEKDPRDPVQVETFAFYVETTADYKDLSLTR